MKIKNIQIEVLQADIHTLSVESKVTECEFYDQETIRKTIAQSLSEAQKNYQKIISFSDLECKDSAFPLVGVAKIMVQEIMNYARAYKSPSVEKVIICLHDGETYQIFDKTVHGYAKHLQEDLGFGPYVTVDIIIELEEGIILIERSNPPYGWALPGGFLEYGESLEETAIREAKEETNMDLENLKQFHTYSKIGRDLRFQTVSTVFIAKGKGEPQFGDDAKDLKVVRYEDLLKLEYAFDHKQIIQDYLNRKAK